MTFTVRDSDSLSTHYLLSLCIDHGIVVPLEQLDDRVFLFESLRARGIIDFGGEIVPPRVIRRSVRYEVMKRQQWRCNSCGMRIRYSRDSAFEGGVCHIDHIHPYSEAASYPRGPSLINEPANLQALCELCNLRKGRSQKV